MTRSALRAFGLLIVATCIAPAADIPRPEHPTPDAVRPHWAILNGPWQFRFDAMDQGLDGNWFEPGAAGYDREIVVPFGWESELSGIHKSTGAPKVGWYRRTFSVPADFPKDHHVWLRFGAVDFRADVWVNGKKVAEHEGGYTPFEADITQALKRDGENTVVVRAFDPTDPSLPTGKQVGWYTPTSGIWQTVWLEARPKVFIAFFSTRAEISPARVTVAGYVSGIEDDPAAHRAYEFSATSDDRTVGLVTGAVAPRAARVRGLDGKTGLNVFTTVLQVDQPKLWSPDSPHLYEITLKLKGPEGEPDVLKTYFGLREIKRARLPGEPFERILLNGKPIYLRGALDQSFNPQGIYTAPSDAFLKKDIELARSFGTNFLRIHIKPDEPRRLYWADRLGMLIMEDMPNTWEQNERARKAWESTLREVVARDRNHPSIFAWVDFNETWGLGRPDQYKADKDTQQWVERMVGLTRELDPTRLVEDNSPCNYDHVAGTDLNSWHFYIDDHASARRHIEEVVARSEPGSDFNYCPGVKMNSAPLINSEYGAVSAGGGDRDVSWGFRDLTTQLRKHAKIQGYIYTELDDIEWEHNGFVDYDRSPKSFGYDAFVPGMTVADLQGDDFVGYDAPPAIVARPGELIGVPLFVSHYSQRQKPPKLRWWITGHDDKGERIELEPRDRDVQWTQNGVTEQKRLAFRLHTPFVGALALVLEDTPGHRIAANFVNIVVKPEAAQPRVERLGDHAVAVRFAPGDFTRSRWSGPTGGVGKAWGQGKGAFTYRLKLPQVVAKAKPEMVEILLEAASKAGREKVDWAERVNGQDYPQTDGHKWPSTLEITINGQRIARRELTDDPADARGVLSHLNRIDHGSHGELIHIDSPLPGSARIDLAAGRTLLVRFAVPEDAPAAGGLCLFGADTGAYPFDPTLVLHTEDELPADLNVKADAPVAIDTRAARFVPILRAGDSMQGAPTTWAYTTSDPGARWAEPGFDDAGWKRGPAGFGTPDTPALQERTPWDSSRIWLRTTFDLADVKPADLLTLHLFHDEDVEILVNGKRLVQERGYLTAYRDTPLDEAQKSLFRPGKNTIAVRCRQTGGGQGIDVGLSMLRGE
jgi:hypothetical protein